MRLILSCAAQSVMEVTLKSINTNQHGKGQGSRNDILSRTSTGIRSKIIFTEHFNNKVLTGGMTARIYK